MEVTYLRPPLCSHRYPICPSNGRGSEDAKEPLAWFCLTLVLK